MHPPHSSLAGTVGSIVSYDGKNNTIKEHHIVTLLASTDRGFVCYYIKMHPPHGSLAGTDGSVVSYDVKNNSIEEHQIVTLLASTDRGFVGH